MFILYENFLSEKPRKVTKKGSFEACVERAKREYRKKNRKGNYAVLCKKSDEVYWISKYTLRYGK